MKKYIYAPGILYLVVSIISWPDNAFAYNFDAIFDENDLSSKTETELDDLNRNTKNKIYKREYELYETRKSIFGSGPVEAQTTDSNDSSYSHGNGKSPIPSSESNARSRNSTKHTGGVKEYYDGGYKSGGHSIYIFRCNNGSKYSAFKKGNGYWHDGAGSNYGDRYRNLSTSDFATKKCN